MEDVTQVEEIRGVMFVGDFDGGDLGGPGNLLWDNALIEVFRNTAAEAASNVLTSNPSPLLDEGVEEDGDFDNDGDVDGRDFLVWQRGGSPVALSAGDLATWQGAYGNPLTAISAVPEPTGITLFATFAGLLVFRRTRQNA